MAKKAQKMKTTKAEPTPEKTTDKSLAYTTAAPLDSYPSDSLVPYDPLKHYLTEIKRYPLLTREEEQRLAIRYIEKADMEAAYRLITSNLRLVVKIALSFQRHWMRNLREWIQEGNIGLMQAVKKFDPYRGYKLSYYAAFCIKACIIKFIVASAFTIARRSTAANHSAYQSLPVDRQRCHLPR